MILVTGGAGFIGSNFVLDWIRAEASPVVNLDKLTYAGNAANLATLLHDARHVFVRGDITDRTLVEGLLARYQPHAIVHFAAESHVDRSIRGPGVFLQTNVVGTCVLLEAARAYWSGLPSESRERFRFLHVSTDEVFGSLGPGDPAFDEATAYAPNSPYAASKAASDHFVRAYHRTYGLPTITTNSSNNYGPFQFPEKLIPLAIVNALECKRVPLYGDGLNVRDWLYVADHCAALRLALSRGAPGATYNIGGGAERTNLDVVTSVLSIMDELRPGEASRHDLIEHVTDRPGHDRRYAIDTSRIRGELGWKPRHTFEEGLRSTVEWYLGNAAWMKSVASGDYRRWVDINYRNRGAA